MTMVTNKTLICIAALLCASIALMGAAAYTAYDESDNIDVADDSSYDAANDDSNGSYPEEERYDTFWVGKLGYKMTGKHTCEVIDYVKNPGDIVVPDYVTYEGVEYKVTAIADYGLTTHFAFGTLPKSVEIGPYIEKIGKKAMSANANMHDGYWSFTIRDIEHSQLREIGEYAFEDAMLTDVVLPASIKTIASNAFYKCQNLEKVAILSDENTAFTVGWHAFKDCKRLQSIDLSKATKIGDSAFEECTSLVKLTIGKAVIGVDSFKRCHGLKELDLSEAVAISHGAFYGCKGLEKVVIGDVMFISTDAFKSCTSLREVTIGSTGEMTDSAFWDCPALEKLTIGKVAAIEDNAFRNSTSLREVTIRDAGSIGDSAFEECTALEKLTIGKAVIGVDSFKRCYSLKELDLTEVTKIGHGAFWNCKGLEKVAIGDVESIGDDAFAECTSLREISFGTIGSIDKGSFSVGFTVDGKTVADRAKELSNKTFIWDESSRCMVNVPVNILDMM